VFGIAAKEPHLTLVCGMRSRITNSIKKKALENLSHERKPLNYRQPWEPLR
jgi:hypothetical protein